MKVLVVLLGLLLCGCSSVVNAADCNANQCESLEDPDQCVALDTIEEIDCVTYTCVNDADVGHGVLTVDEGQEKRCNIHGECYSVGSGPNLCTYCQENEDGTIGVNPGCVGPEDKCVPVLASVTDGCAVKLCSIRDNAVDLHTVGTIGCSRYGECYSVGDKYFRYSCDECSVDPETSLHFWEVECYDPRNGMCFPRDSLYNINCIPFVCGNRGGVGWYRTEGDSCQIEEGDCVSVGGTSLRDGYCYYCEAANSEANVGCNICGECLKDGESVMCEGSLQTCGNVDDPPPTDDIVCEVNGQSIAVDETVESQCNTYKCTQFGVQQLTDKCFYNGDCVDVGTLDEADCIFCVSDGRTTSVDQGCKYRDQCYEQGATVRINCVTKECMRMGNRMRFMETEFQPTPCRCSGECYPIGDVEYAHPKLCGYCHENGTMEYSCKLHDGSCLGAGQEEQIPSLGCYRMQCSYDADARTYRIHKADGQPHRCPVPDGGCLEEGERREIDGRTYQCIEGDKCPWGNGTVDVGETVEYGCHVLGCEEYEKNGVRTFKMEVLDWGCPYGDDCKELNAEYDVNCVTYKCEQQEGKDFAQHVEKNRRCEVDGICVEVGEHIWTARCDRRDCNDDFSVNVTEVGCVNDGACVKPGEGDGTCVDSLNNCVYNNYVVPLGEELAIDCNTYVCEKKPGYLAGLYLAAAPRCTMTYDGQQMCWDAGTELHCVMCIYNEAGFSYEQRCIGSDGECVDIGASVPYGCGTGVCDVATRRMVQETITSCNVAGECVAEGDDGLISYLGTNYLCTCLDPSDSRGYACRFAP